MASKKQLKAAEGYLKQDSSIDVVYVNPSGHVFTKRSYGLSSVAKESQLAEVRRADLTEEAQASSAATKEQQELFDKAVEQGIITRNHGWYKLNDDTLDNQRDEAINALDAEQWAFIEASLVDDGEGSGDPTNEDNEDK